MVLVAGIGFVSLGFALLVHSGPLALLAELWQPAAYATSCKGQVLVITRQAKTRRPADGGALCFWLRGQELAYRPLRAEPAQSARGLPPVLNLQAKNAPLERFLDACRTVA